MRAQRAFTVTPLARASRHFAYIDSTSGSSVIAEEHLREGSTRGLVIEVSRSDRGVACAAIALHGRTEFVRENEDPCKSTYSRIAFIERGLPDKRANSN